MVFFPTSVAQSPPYQRTDYGLPWISFFFSEVVNLVPTMTAFDATSLRVVAGRAAVVLGNDSSLALLLVPRALLYQAMDYSERTTCRVDVVRNHEHGGASRICSNCSTSSPSFHVRRSGCCHAIFRLDRRVHGRLSFNFAARSIPVPTSILTVGFPRSLNPSICLVHGVLSLFGAY